MKLCMLVLAVGVASLTFGLVMAFLFHRRIQRFKRGIPLMQAESSLVSAEEASIVYAGLLQAVYLLEKLGPTFMDPQDRALAESIVNGFLEPTGDE